VLAPALVIGTQAEDTTFHQFETQAQQPMMMMMMMMTLRFHLRLRLLCLHALMIMRLGVPVVLPLMPLLPLTPLLQ
jgi:hypothetical protein